MNLMNQFNKSFGENFNAKEAVHTDRSEAHEVLPVPKQGSAPVADLLRPQPVQTDMS